MMASAPRIILESGQHQHSPVPFPSLHTNPSQLDAKHTPNPFTPHALAIPSHRMPFPSLHTACPPCTRIMTNLLEKTTQKWRISKRWRSTREVQTAQLDPRHMLCKYCAHNRVRPGCEVAAEKADFTTMSDTHARTSPGQAHLPPLPTLPWRLAKPPQKQTSTTCGSSKTWMPLAGTCSHSRHTSILTALTLAKCTELHGTCGAGREPDDTACRSLIGPPSPTRTAANT